VPVDSKVRLVRVGPGARETSAGWLAGLRAQLARRARFRGSGAYWENRYRRGGNSGRGSYGELAAFKAEVLNAFVREHEVESVLELGCGDGNQLRLAVYPRYLGFDVSETAVASCRRLFADDGTKSFAVVVSYAGEQVDLALSLDVIYHLVEDDVFEAHMRTLFAAARRFVIVYSSDVDDRSRSRPHVRHREFTRWVAQHEPSWFLEERVANRYPGDPSAHQGSAADFYVFRRKTPP